MVKIGINGFGRIGRNVFKALLENYGSELQVVAINDLTNAKTLAHLLKYDSLFGKFEGTVEAKEDSIIVNGNEIKIFAEREPSNIPWSSVGCEIVIESTGFFTDGEKAKAHINGSVKKVLISAPAKNEDITIVMGVNNDKYDPSKHNVISNALRRARAAAESMIPTTTGAAKAVALVLPELKGKLNGFALRVPTPTVSCTDLVAELSKEVTVEEVNASFKKASETTLKGILGYEEAPLVSMDYRQDKRSSIIDALCTMVIEGNMVKVVSWYDNEWGYSNRLADLAQMVAKSL